MTPIQAYVKCNGEINKDLEPFIIKDPEWAFHYSHNIIKDRWGEAEQYIINDSYLTYCYAINVIKGKLPENMHNAMLIHADIWTKEYFNFIKKYYG
jgi:hypothetical protein